MTITTNKAWTPLVSFKTQIQAYQSTKRFNVVPAGRRCLAKGTLVATPKGPVRIEKLNIGDLVVGVNKYNDPEVTKIIETYDNGIQEVQELTNEWGHWLKKSTKIIIKATLEHRLWATNTQPDNRLEFNYEKIKIKDIDSDTWIYFINEAGQQFASRWFKKGKITKEQTYDITVGNSTNLYLLANGIVTSNSGKTEIIGKRKQVLRFLLCHDKRYPQFYSKYSDPRFFIAAPTRDQVKGIYWNDIKKLVPRQYLAKPSVQSNLILYGRNGASLHLLGLDRPERIEGMPWDHGVVDEIGNVKAGAWEANIRPALSDRRGGCDFIGVPEGRNHYYDMWKKAKVNASGEWGHFHWVSADVLPLYGRENEVEAARADMDELTFQQEFEASFVNFTGMAYYNFNEKVNVGNYKRLYNPDRALILCFDFNVAPGVCVICQELGADTFKIPLNKTVTVVLDEVYIPKDSNTIRVCKKVIQDWKFHRGNVLCYGDATGGSKGSAKAKGSDWDLIKQELMPYFGNRLYLNVPKANPRERQRVNAVNSRLKSATNEVKLVFDSKCKHLLIDMEGVRVIEGSAGEIDKKSDPKLTHLSDALGYYVFKEYPVFQWWSADDINTAMKRVA